MTSCEGCIGFFAFFIILLALDLFYESICMLTEFDQFLLLRYYIN